MAGTDVGPFLSTDNGALWTKKSEGLLTLDPYVNILSAGFVPVVSGKPYAVVGTWGRGVWKRPMSDMVTSAGAIADNRPTHIVLEQNYPNPFNPSTTVHFEIPAEVHVALNIYNMLGQKVLVVLDDVKAAGGYDVRVDASGLPSGAYFYRLRAGDYIQSRKLLLIK